MIGFFVLCDDLDPLLMRHESIPPSGSITHACDLFNSGFLW
jgi:hypothetical protein